LQVLFHREIFLLEGPNKKSKCKKKMMQGGSDDEEKDVDETENPKLDDKQLEFCQFIKGGFKTFQ